MTRRSADRGAGRALKGILCGLAAGAALSLGGAAQAETEGAYLNSSNYFYRIYGMPDFDQVRGPGPGVFSLPNSGFMYCAPTSAFNMFAYIANHGFPEMSGVGAQWWQSSSMYNAVGLSLLNVGNFMGTHPDNGTGGAGFRDGAKAWVEGRSNAFTVTYNFANNNYAPTQAAITHAAVCGSLVSFSYGRYDEVGSFNGIPLLDRTGGHVVTLSRSTDGFGDARRLWVRDPADEQNNRTTQSEFGDRKYGQVNERFVATAPSFGALKIMTEIGVNPGAPGSSNRYIDSYLQIRPKLGYALTQNSTVLFILPQLLIPSFPQPPMLEFDLSAEILDAVINPDMNEFFATTQSAEGVLSLVCVNAATGEKKDLSEELGISAPSLALFGRNRQLYVLDGRMLKCFNMDVDPPVEEAVVIPPAPVVAIAYNDAMDTVVCLSDEENALISYPSSLLGDGSVTPMPGAVSLMDDASMAYNPGEGTLLIHPGGGQNVAYQATPSRARGEFDYSISSISLNGLVKPRDIEADDSGMFYVMTEAGAQGYARDENNRFGPVSDALFNGAFSEGMFRLTHGRINDGEYPAEEYYNILPTELMQGGFSPDCEFDLDGDGEVGSVDLGRLLASWTEVGVRGDRDGNGVGSGDLGAMLAAWGPCD